MKMRGEIQGVTIDGANLRIEALTTIDDDASDDKAKRRITFEVPNEPGQRKAFHVGATVSVVLEAAD